MVLRLRPNQRATRLIERESGRERGECLKRENAAAVVIDMRPLLAGFRLVFIVVVNVQEQHAAMRLH